MPTDRSAVRTQVRTLVMLLAGWALALGVVLLTGLLLTRVLADRWPLTSEDGVNRALASARTPAGDNITWLLSRLGDTGTVVAACTVAVIVLRLVLHRWRESIFVAACTIGQSVVFLFTTLAIERERPDVPKLDDSPPTSSFPSGHTGASLVLCLALAVVVHRQVRRQWARWSLIVLLLLIPLSVAAGRLYRGMHHPTDIAGSVLNAVLVVLITSWVLNRYAPEDAPAAEDEPSGTKSA